MGVHQPTPAVFAFGEPGPRSGPHQGASGFGVPGNIAQAPAGQGQGQQVEGQGHQISDQQTGAVASDPRTEQGSIGSEAPQLPVNMAPSLTGPASTSQPTTSQGSALLPPGVAGLREDSPARQSSSLPSQATATRQDAETSGLSAFCSQ